MSITDIVCSKTKTTGDSLTNLAFGDKPLKFEAKEKINIIMCQGLWKIQYDLAENKTLCFAENDLGKQKAIIDLIYWLQKIAIHDLNVQDEEY